MAELDGKVALVTGAGSGIGREIALELARAGASVCVADVDRGAAEAVAGDASTGDRPACACIVDVSDRRAVEHMTADLISRRGRLDIVVNNAGIGQYLPFQDITEDDWDRMLGIHLKGTFNVIQASLPHLKVQTDARIINMASVAGITGTPTHCHYSAAKAGIIGLTKSLAKELAAFGITVNALAPGLIDTPFAKLVAPSLVEVYLQRTPLKRMGTSEDVAWACRFLAAPRSGFITGQVLSPNGGFLI